jgi:hypothetical protein
VAIVLIGPHGLGSTQQYEREFAITRQTREPLFPIVLVILPEAAYPSIFAARGHWAIENKLHWVLDRHSARTCHACAPVTVPKTWR